MRYCFQWLNVDSMIMWQKHTRMHARMHTHTHTHTFNGPFSRTTRMSQYQKGKAIWILLKQERVSGSGISCAICKSAPRSRETTTPAPHHSVFYRPDALPAAQPTVSKHWRQTQNNNFLKFHKLSVSFKIKQTIRYCSTTIENNWQ